MSALLVTLHVIVALLLVGAILLQPGSKGGGLSATFGGGGANSAFGARGAAPVLAKLTYWLAAGFMVTSLVIEIKIVQDNRSVLERKPAAAKATADSLKAVAAKSK
ncbi:MAG TPA: preprotein translocase subunit SecG, partial [Holophaga sp.]|nr:preprotein translocase subunit SecG [Holophaga sp.]